MPISTLCKKIFIILLISFVSKNLCAQATDTKSVEMSYRDKNDFKEALKPVPKDAVFKMEGYYLWDPSVIKVRGTYHLFTSRWPVAGGTEGWKKSQVIRATSKSLFGP